MVDSFLHIDIFGHHGKVWFDEWAHLNLSLGFKLSHLRIVAQPVDVQEVVIETDVSYFLVVKQWLKAHSAKVWQVYRALHVYLTIAPTKFKLLGRLQFRN